MNNFYEILAPAGNYETFLAVLNAGADAVYLAGNMFGARAYAGNLSEEELLKAIDYCHIHNKKLYLTVNTLLKNNELFNKLYDYLCPLYNAGLDGVIVQDYGVMKFIHDNFPDMEIHASTQMTITDHRYCDFLRKYNVSRIVPAREMSLEDIRRLKENTDMEIECFVHGALCYSYSGMCFMSSLLGDRSGNRGRCAQPCRLNYSEGNVLSLKDLCTLDILPDILEAGVFSLKIEGRMKSPEYAAGVTAIYRKYVDMYINKGREGYTVDSTDKDKLLMLFDRGGMTDGYYNNHNGKHMIADNDKSDKSLTDKSEYEKYIKDKYLNNGLKKKIDIYVKLHKNEQAYIRILDDEGNDATIKYGEISQALKQPATIEDVADKLKKLGNTDYYAGAIDIDMDSDVFIPVKLLNELRREAVNALNKKVLEKYRRQATPVTYEFNNIKKENGNIITARVYTLEQVNGAIKGGATRICIESELIKLQDIDYIINECHNKNIECFLGMPRVFKNKLDFIKDMNFDGFYIRNISELVFLDENNIEGTRAADYTVYGFNDLSVKILYDNGFDEVVYPIELNSKELYHLNNLHGELVVYGHLPLMVSANCIDKTLTGCHHPNARFGVIKDRKKARLNYVTACKFCYNVIFNSVPLFLQDKFDELKRIGAKSYSFCFTDESEAMVTLIIKQAISGNVTLPDNYTRGHYTRGVE